MNPFTLPTKFTVIDEFSARVKRMGMALNDITQKSNASIARQERLFRRLSPAIGDVAKQTLSFASTTAIAAGIAYSGKKIMDYETAIQSLSAVTGVTGDQLENMKSEINSVAVQTKKSAADIAGSFEVVGSAMSQYLQDPKALREITEAGITLAKASRSELVPTLENLTSIMNQFDLKASQAEATINRLTAGEIVGSLKTSQVADALKEFGANAYTANVSLSESVALVETLAKQMKLDKIGVGARNLITVLDAAKALDKSARKAMKHAGVDTKILTDRTKSLGERLRELSKISASSTAMIKVFGKENVTAANVLFTQMKLGTYDSYLQGIEKTNKAHEQAAINSTTLAVKLAELRDKFINNLTAATAVGSGMDKLKNAVMFVTENMDFLIKTGVNVLKFYALWKAAIIAQKVVTMGLTAALVVQNAVSAAYFLVDMVKYVAVTQGITKATASWLIVQESLTAAMMANPLGLMLAAVAALAGGIYFLNKRHDELIENYKAKINLQTIDHIKKETDAIDQLALKYIKLGHSIKESYLISIKAHKATADTQRAASEKKISELKGKIQGEDRKVYGLMYGTILQDLFSPKGKYQEQLAEEQTKAHGISESQTAVALRASQLVDKGVLNKKDLGGMFDQPKTNTPTFSDNWLPQPKEAPFTVVTTKEEKALIDYERLKDALKKETQEFIITFKNAPAGTTISSTDGSPITTNQSY